MPTATYIRTTKPEEAKAYITKTGAPIVVKASGLCAGKGVIICESVEDGHKAVDEMMMDKVFGASGDEVSLLLSLFLCLCVFVYGNVCTSMYTHMHVCVYIHPCTHTCMCVCICMCMCI